MKYSRSLCSRHKLLSVERANGKQHGGAAIRCHSHLALTPVEGAEGQVRSHLPPSHQITGTTVGEGQENWAECQQMSRPTVVLVRSRDSGGVCTCALPPSFSCVFFSHKYFMTCLFSCLRRSSHLLLQSVDADSHSPLIPAGAVATSVKRRTPF